MVKDYWIVPWNDNGKFNIFPFEWWFGIKKKTLLIPTPAQIVIDWCILAFGEVGIAWSWAVGVSHVMRRGDEMLNGRGHDCAYSVEPKDIIFIFYSEEAAVEFKLVWE